ncbi:hypothetical protein [Cellulomonas iranensis]|uniref:hypothetical protein n=1 Tax=Cellulomonas iranensis TaxID=76862 RepID=UPI0013D71468|nr:hypothetical protein [Cellulomonas iranensis]
MRSLLAFGVLFLLWALVSLAALGLFALATSVATRIGAGDGDGSLPDWFWFSPEGALAWVLAGVFLQLTATFVGVFS